MFFLGLERSGPQTHLDLEIWVTTVFLRGLFALTDLLADTACQETPVGCYYLLIKLVLNMHIFPRAFSTLRDLSFLDWALVVRAFPVFIWVKDELISLSKRTSIFTVFKSFRKLWRWCLFICPGVPSWVCLGSWMIVWWFPNQPVFTDQFTDFAHVVCTFHLR